jgi:hypothetical protein
MMIRTRSCLLVASLVAIAAGCASYSGSNLVPGKSTAAEVEVTMGKPADRIGAPGGDSVWYYPRGLTARQTFAVRLGADGVVREVSQVRTLANLGKLQIGQSTPADVRAVLGPPDKIWPMRRIERDVWEYTMYEDTLAIIVYVQIDPAGRVREVFQVRDPFYDSRGSGKT